MRLVIPAVLLLISVVSFGQETNKRLDESIDEVTYNWDLEADKLATYDGLLFVCANEEYRTRILSMLNEIHHLDSVLYDVLTRMSRTSSDKEIKKTIKDIEKFESEYGTRQFISFMSEECKAAREIERNADDTRNEVAQNSYSGQVYLLETELYKYVNQITKRVDKIRLHVHHLSAHYE